MAQRMKPEKPILTQMPGRRNFQQFKVGNVTLRVYPKKIVMMKGVVSVSLPLESLRPAPKKASDTTVVMAGKKRVTISPDEVEISKGAVTVRFSFDKLKLKAVPKKKR